jgi:hypothetical protein
VGGIRLVVEDVHLAVSYLHDIDVAGVGVTWLEVERHVEAKLAAVVVEVVGGEDDRHLDRDGCGVVHEHELLHGFVAELVLGD